MAAVVTNIAACVGGITWCLVDYRLEKKWSTVGFCSGVIAGLVAITPGSGYVPAWSAVVFGLMAGIGCNFATQIKYWVGADDALDIFAVHGVGGFIGNICTALFASRSIAHLDGFTVIKGGWLDHHWAQLAIQLGDSAAGAVWSFTLTCLILIAMSVIGNHVPALRLRVSEHEEELGIDDVELGEFAYDYVEVVREVKPLDAPSVINGIREDGEDGSSHRCLSQNTIRDAVKGVPEDMYPLEAVSHSRKTSTWNAWEA